MTIRRLVLDDDEEEQQQENEIQQLQPQQPAVTATRQPPNSTNFPSEPLQISDDDDFIDVSDNLSTPSPPPPRPPPPPQPQPPGSSVGDSLSRLGLGLRTEWLGGCLRELEGSVRGFAGFDVTAKAKLCFEQFLFADMNSCGSGVLPPNVHSMHLVNLTGPFVLQVRLRLFVSLHSTIALISYILILLLELLWYIAFQYYSFVLLLNSNTYLWSSWSCSLVFAKMLNWNLVLHLGVTKCVVITRKY